VQNGSDSDLTPPEEILRVTQPGIPGDGRDVEEAIRNAWGKRESGDSRVYRIQEVYVWGENPISGYRVVIGPTG
jgi:hypothetical protein